MVDQKGLEQDTTTPRVVGVITAYRSAAYVERAMRSLRSQDYPNLDCFLIDDASPDDTFARAQQAATRIGGFRVLQNERNIGFSGSLNRALGMCGPGDLLFVHQDDVELADPSYLSRAVRWLESPHVALVTGQPAGWASARLSLPERIFTRLLLMDYEDRTPSETSYSLLKADLISADAARAVGGFAFVVNRSLGLEDKLFGAGLTGLGYKLIKDPSLKYFLGYARTETTWHFLAKEWHAGCQLAYAIAQGMITPTPFGREIRAKRNLRIIQVGFGVALFASVLLAAGTPAWGFACLVATLIGRAASLVPRGRGFAGRDRAALVAVGLAHDLLFFAGFAAGGLSAAASRVWRLARAAEPER